VTVTYVKRDGSTVTDPRLGRLPEHDPRGLLNYPIAARLTAARTAGKRRGKTWQAGDEVLDQGPDGACVGFAFTHERTAEPVPADAGSTEAMAVYRRAQYLDPWPETGIDGADGTSILAGCKAAVVLTLPTVNAGEKYGPAVAGVNWHDSMFEPDDEGYLEVTGPIVGGHAVLVRGCRLKARRHGKLTGEPVLVVRNSWGPEWGDGGDCYLLASDFQRIMGDTPDVAVPVRRRK
jgi:hypothetical protein